MKGERADGNIIELDKKFSTTRRVIQVDQCADLSQINDERKVLTIPNHIKRIDEGGIRTRGYIKSSEKSIPLISVVTVVRNGKKHLERAIQSVINQTYDNVEYIIIDGASSDGSLDIIKKYEGVLDYWVSEPDQGVYDAMNKGISLFRGDYILFLGCDDVLFDIFHKIARFFDRSAVSYYWNVVLSNNERTYDGKFSSYKLFLKNIPHQAIFYSRQVFYMYSFNTKYIAVADYNLNLKIFADKKYGFKYIPYTIAKYNNEHGLSSNIIDHAFSADKPEIIRKNFSKPSFLIYMLIRYLFKSHRK
jgi:glycosyltransferase involved in cell wall biosynthesis